MGWYVVETKPLCETKVQDAVHEIGLETFLPKMRRITRTRKELRHRRNPPNPFLLIFPRYLFVRFDLAEDKFVWPAITRQDGVLTILGMNTQSRFPSAIQDQDFVRLQELAQELSKEPLSPNSRPTPLPVETMVRVLWGPLAGVSGKIEFDNGIRADVLLASAGVASKITLPRELIETL